MKHALSSLALLSIVFALPCACGGRTTPAVPPTNTSAEGVQGRDVSAVAASPAAPPDSAGRNVAPVTALALANAKNLTRYDDETAIDGTPATITTGALASERSDGVGPHAIARLPAGWDVRVVARRQVNASFSAEDHLLVAWQEAPGMERWLGGWVGVESIEPIPRLLVPRERRPKACLPGTLPYDGACAKQCFQVSDCRSRYCVPNGPPRSPAGHASSVCLEHRGDEDVDASLSMPRNGACPPGKVLAVGVDSNVAGYLVCAKPYREGDRCLGARDLLLPDRVGRVRVEFLCPGDP